MKNLKTKIKELNKKEMLKEMAEYGWTEEKIRTWYKDTNKEISFNEYLKCFYMSDTYINK